jgi:hypothetical protein
MLGSYVKRRPFIPFVVELADGRRIAVETRDVGFGGGVAGFINDDGALDGFSYNDVRSMHFVSPEAAT